MSTIHWLSPDERGEWDAFVTRHPLGLVYHLSAWQRVLESAFRHIRGRFLVLRDGGGQIQAGLPVYRKKLAIKGQNRQRAFCNHVRSADLDPGRVQLAVAGN